MSVSLKDISRVTNINTCSISWVLNNHPRAMTLRPATREKILRAAASLGYCRNELAASVARRRSNLLIFVAAEMGNIEYTGHIQNGILNAASGRDYTIIVFRLSSMPAEEILRKIIGWKAAGVIFHIPSLASARVITHELDRQGIPWGTVNLGNPGGIGVTSDDREGLCDAVRYLAETGHVRPCYLTLGEVRFEYQERRIEGFLQGLKRFYPGQEESVFHFTHEHVMSDHEPLCRFIRTIQERQIDAVFCEQDSLASVLCIAAGEMQVHLPEAFSVIGFGNSLIAPYVSPPLTTISQDFEEMGRCTTSAIIDLIERKQTLQELDVLQPVRLVQRKSVQSRTP